MKFLKLKFTSARVIKELHAGNSFRTNVFFHPINKMHVYNSICVLLGRTPKPQLRETSDLYLQFFDDVMKIVEEGYIKTTLVCENEKITTVKKNWNANATKAEQITWYDCEYVLGTLLPTFIEKASNILDISSINVRKTPFDTVISNIQNKGIKKETLDKNGVVTHVFVYNDTEILNLIKWLVDNNSTVIKNYIENIQVESKAKQFGKRIYRGCVDTNIYCGFIYIPLEEKSEIYNELIKYTCGFSKILDGGLVTILGYDYINEYDILGFTEIKNLNDTKKYDIIQKNIKWYDTIYKTIRKPTLKSDIDDIIAKCGVVVSDYQNEYDSMMTKIYDISSANDIYDNKCYTKIALKVNNFIENSINKQYKKNKIW